MGVIPSTFRLDHGVDAGMKWQNFLTQFALAYTMGAPK
jgi:hypothetical protein